MVSSLKDALPAHLTEKVVDVGRVDSHAREDDIVAETLDLLRQKDADTDREKVTELVDAWQGGGLGVVGPEATIRALQMGQVEELLIVASADALKPVQQPTGDVPAPVSTQTSAASNASEKQLQLSDDLVTRAQQTGARVRIIEIRSCCASTAAWARRCASGFDGPHLGWELLNEPEEQGQPRLLQGRGTSVA